MEKKNGKQLIILLLLLVVLIGGGTVLYRRLQEVNNEAVNDVALDNQTENIRTEEQKAENRTADGQISDGQSADEQAVESQVEKERFEIPDFTVVDVDGNETTLSDLKGKPVVINFWASWCPPCKAEMPEFNAVYEELGEEVHFMMIDAADGHRETVESGSAYVTEQGFVFPVYYDIGQEVIMEYGIRSFPSTLFLDSEGYAVTGYVGQINEEILREGIEMCMSEAKAE